MGVVRVCPYCGADSAAVVQRLKRAFASSGSDGLGVTQALITVNLFLFVAAIVVGGTSAGGGFDFFTPNIEVLFRLGLQENHAVDAGQWWRLFLMMFLHLGLLHVAFNCYILYYCGRLLEDEFGGRLLFFVYIVSGLAGSVASYFFNIGGGGASGAVFGLLGAIVTRRRLVDGNFRHPLTQQLLYLLGINVVFGLAMPGINNAAHGGGFLAGAALAWLLTRVRLSRAGAIGFALGTWSAALATAVAFASMVLSLFAGSSGDLRTANACWRDTEIAARGDYVVDLVEGSRRCLAELPRLEGPANTARDAARGAWDIAADAYEEGNAGQMRRAQAAIIQQVAAYFLWENEALPRYGLVKGRAPP
jgi:membrane associated rhomboid family serine protease